MYTTCVQCGQEVQKLPQKRHLVMLTVLLSKELHSAAHSVKSLVPLFHARLESCVFIASSSVIEV